MCVSPSLRKIATTNVHIYVVVAISKMDGHGLVTKHVMNTYLPKRTKMMLY